MHPGQSGRHATIQTVLLLQKICLSSPFSLTCQPWSCQNAFARSNIKRPCWMWQHPRVGQLGNLMPILCTPHAICTPTSNWPLNNSNRMRLDLPYELCLQTLCMHHFSQPLLGKSSYFILLPAFIVTNPESGMLARDRSSSCSPHNSKQKIPMTSRKHALLLWFKFVPWKLSPTLKQTI